MPYSKILSIHSTVSYTHLTISRYMNEAIENGYAKRDKKGIHLLREDIFLITSESQLAIIKNLYPEIITDEDLERGYIA